MKKFLITLATLTAAFFLFNAYIYYQKQADESKYSFGTYAYECQNGAEFSMLLPEDMESILIVPAEGVDYIPRTIISKAESETGTRYEGNGLTFLAHGETVEFWSEEFATFCAPIVNQDEAPFNFGD